MKVVIIAGHSASGKSTVLEQLCEKHDFVKLVTTTTREPRPGEVNGVDYHFITKDEFKEQVANQQFLEHVEIKGNFYGSSLNEFNKDLNGKTPVIILDPIGTKEALSILSENGHEPVSVFVNESPETCIERVLNRPAEPAEKQKRIHDIKNAEAGWSTYLDYDFKTTPLVSIEQNCSDILNFVYPKEPSVRNDSVRTRRNKFK